MSKKILHIGDATVDVELLRGYTAEALGHLNKQSSYKTQFDEVVEAAVETTKLDKKVLSAYFKARFKVQTKEATEKGELFSALDDALDEPLA